MSKFASGQVITGLDYKYPEGAMRVHEVLPDGSITAYPEGGGFQMKFSAEAVVKNRLRVVSPEEMRAAAFRAGRFVIDCWEEEVFEGWHNGERWNGWAKPYFSLATARRILELCKKDGVGKASYEKGRDRFVFQGEHDEEPMLCPATDLPGVSGKFYPIGTGSWTWSEAPERDDAEET